MCGIIGAVSQNDIVAILLKGLYRLEYRGYDSSGIAVINNYGHLQRLRRVGKVKSLAEAEKKNPINGKIGIAHTRWATHGEPTQNNAHPHVSNHIVVVHNGIIENHESLRKLLYGHGYIFISDTDTEVLTHLIHWEQYKNGENLIKTMIRVIPQLCGSYSAVIMDSRDPSLLIGICSGSPLVIGIGDKENFLASDQTTLLPFTKRFVFLEEGDIAEVGCCHTYFWNSLGQSINRIEVQSKIKGNTNNKGSYHHYMQKEIFEQPEAIKNTLKGRYDQNKVILTELDYKSDVLFNKVQQVQIVACGTSYHSAMVSKYWFESLAEIPCNVDIASEFRYRKSIVQPGTLLITLSQSGETADTLAALRLTKTMGYLSSITICNVAGSSLVRESDLAIMTCAGIEISVASTKAFTTQMTALLILIVRIARFRGMKKYIEKDIVQILKILPKRIEQILKIEKKIKLLSEKLSDKQHALFIGRGDLYPIAMEGALKMKEISYIHAEAYAAGELKHGPLALIDDNMPVIALVNKNNLLEKLKSNIEEVRARRGKLYILAEEGIDFMKSEHMSIITLPKIETIIAPIFYAIPLQLLAYHTALTKGTNVDQPRNLAKSVTVE